MSTSTVLNIETHLQQLRANLQTATQNRDTLRSRRSAIEKDLQRIAAEVQVLDEQFAAGDRAVLSSTQALENRRDELQRELRGITTPLRKIEESVASIETDLRDTTQLWQREQSIARFTDAEQGAKETYEAFTVAFREACLAFGAHAQMIDRAHAEAELLGPAYRARAQQLLRLVDLSAPTVMFNLLRSGFIVKPDKFYCGALLGIQPLISR